MIVTRAPFRISFVGGGSDYVSFFRKFNGATVGSSIDYYVYVYLNKLSSIAPERIRFTYGKTESVLDIDELAHPSFKATLKYFDISSGINVGTLADLPSGNGLGGSSAFLVALIKALSEFRCLRLSDKRIAEIAIEIERDILNEAGGVQDQYQAAFGDFRGYTFSTNNIQVSEPLMSRQDLEFLESRLALIWTGQSRNSMEYAKITEGALQVRTEKVIELSKLAQGLISNLSQNIGPELKFECIAQALKRGSEIKTSISGLHHESVQDLQNKLRPFGLLGQKLCGAGGTGFLLILAEPTTIESISKTLPHYVFLRPKLGTSGVEIITK